jgi:phage portal protein BeeE
MFRVPPHKIGIMDRATFSNIEHQAIEYVTDTLSSLAKMIESHAMLSLLTQAEQDDYFIEINLDGLLRGDILSRYRAYAIGRNWGWLSADEVREFENFNPLPDGIGRTYLVPTNMDIARDDMLRDDASAAQPRRTVLYGADGRQIATRYRHAL